MLERFFARIPLTTMVSGLAAAAVLPACTTAPPVPQTPVMVITPTEVETPEATVAGYHCDGTPYHIEGRDYCAYATPETWVAAKRLCASSGGQLATLPNHDKASGLSQALGSPVGAAEALWLGLHEPRAGVWQWLDGAQAQPARWAKGEPNDDGGAENCAEWQLGAGTWNDAPCDDDRGYICEQATAGGASALQCDEQRRVETTTSTYCLYFDERKSWQDAKDACAATGGVLAMVTTQEENKLFYAAVGPRLGLASVWVGFNDLAREGSWKWVSGARGHGAPWKAGEPNDFEENEDCAEWFPGNGHMNDLSCTAKRPFLCERGGA